MPEAVTHSSNRRATALIAQLFCEAVPFLPSGSVWLDGLKVLRCSWALQTVVDGDVRAPCFGRFIEGWFLHAASVAGLSVQIITAVLWVTAWASFQTTLEFVVDGKDMDCLHVNAYETAAVLVGIKQLGVAESPGAAKPHEMRPAVGAMYDNE